MALSTISRRLLRNIIPTQGMNLFVKYADFRSNSSPSRSIHGEKAVKDDDALERFQTLSKQMALELEVKYARELALLHPTMNITESSKPIVISLESWCRWLASVPCEKRRELCYLMKKCNVQVVRHTNAPVMKLKRPPTIAKWEGSLDEEELTCSVDGTFTPGNPMDGGYCGGLFRNYFSLMEGDIWFFVVWHAKNIFDVEFSAIIGALKFFVTQGHDKRYKKLLVQCDNYEAVHFANGTRVATIKDRVELVGKFTAMKAELEKRGVQVRVEYVRGFTNKAADAIVKLFANLKSARVRGRGGSVMTVDLTQDNLSDPERKAKQDLLKKSNIGTVIKEDETGIYRIRL